MLEKGEGAGGAVACGRRGNKRFNAMVEFGLGVRRRVYSRFINTNDRQ